MYFKLGVIGSRNITNKSLIYNFLDNYYELTAEYISGGAKGVDSIVEQWCKDKNRKITIIKPDYKKYPSKVAPIIRNKEIVNESNKIIAFWDGESKGTKSVIDYCKKINKNIEIIYVKD